MPWGVDDVESAEPQQMLPTVHFMGHERAPGVIFGGEVEECLTEERQADEAIHGWCLHG